MDFSLCISLPPLREKCHESILTPVFRSYWECLTDTDRFHLYSVFDCTTPIFCARKSHEVLFSERVWMILPTKVVSKATGQQQLSTWNWQGLFWAEGKLHEKGRVESSSYVFTRTWSGKAEHSLGSVWWSRQRLVFHFFWGMTGLGWLWVCCLTWSSVSAVTGSKQGWMFLGSLLSRLL